ncbi:MAG: M23 family metallopeptidase [Asgard group archaeon]|nr:M23 family metallopeptidase [Asgard group archaeon]
MQRKWKIILGITIPILVIGGGIGGYTLWSFWPANWSGDPPVIAFPVADPDVIHILGGYGTTPEGWFHNGIDFGCNASVNILAWCDLRVVNVHTWFNDKGGHWQTNLELRYNSKYSFSVPFESWALNETYANLQRDAINVTVGQIVHQGEILGKLLYHGDGCHIHFGMRENGEDVCPYLFFSDDCKVLFDALWIHYGIGTICEP